MANILLTQRCNAACPFCFAEENVEKDFSIASFTQILEQLYTDGISEIRLLGGEPTLHPNFTEIMEICRASSRIIHLFSNGSFSRSVLEQILEIPATRCNVLINCTASLSPALENRRIENLTALSQRVQLSVTIAEPSCDFSYAFQLVQRYNLKKQIRIGLALPALSHRNQSLHPKQYRIIGTRLTEASIVAAKQGITFEADCGFVHCMFSEEEHQILALTGFRFISHCGAIPDICADGVCFPCFGLAGIFDVQLSEYDTIPILRTALNRKFAPFRSAGIYRTCFSCREKLEQRCSGGCMAQTLRQVRSWDNREKSL